MFHWLVHLPFAGRVAIAVAALAPAGALMGMMLPLGVRWLHHTNLQPLVAWAWGVNGAASVLGTVLAVALSINLGFGVTQLSASAVYLLAACCLPLASSLIGRRAEA
ncbi:MAG: hypothetical protein D6806_18945 [Deltaproteobacteria bacterium]|nr:MAG: hypothetical protein D6806_18945 [Deltaproteobacteria bacterium]